MKRDVRTSICIFGPWECLRAFYDVRFKSHSRLELLLGQSVQEDLTGVELESKEAIHACKAVHGYIAGVERAFGKSFTCLMASLAAKRILARKGVISVLYVGVRLDSDGASGKRDFKAHSWLKCGSRVIVGQRDMEKFKVLKIFT